MRRQRKVLHHLFAAMEWNAQPLPGVPLVELAGDSRVLIENHSGVTEYTENKVSIQVSYGKVFVCGNSLEISLMTKHQLIITGRIDMVGLERSGK